MRSAGVTFTDRLRAERRRFEVFRKGRVTHIDTTVDPVLLTVHDGERSRRMPYIRENVSVGDVVRWVDQADPFAWGRELSDGGAQVVPLTVGLDAYALWYPERDLDAANHETILKPFVRVTGSGYVYYPNGVMLIAQSYSAAETTASLSSVDSLVEVHGNPVTSSWPAPPYAEPDEVSTHYSDVDGMTLLSTTDVGANNVGPAMFRLSGWSYEDRAPLGSSDRWDHDVGYVAMHQRVVAGCPEIYEAVWATTQTDLVGGTKNYFPSISSPGTNWPVLYLMHVPTTDHDKFGGRAGTSISVSKGADNSDVVASLSGSVSPVTHGLGILRARTIGAGDPEAWVQPSADVAGVMLSSLVLVADPTWTGPGFP